MKIYKNGSIITLNENAPKADYMAVEGGKIVDIGIGEGWKAHEQNAEIIDLQGRTVIPGFWESHLHIVDGTRSIIELSLRDCADFEQLEKKIKDYAAKLQEHEWVIGYGWDESKVFGGKFPDRHLIDGICSTHPVVLNRMDGHSLCVNTKAIEVQGLHKLTPSAEAPFCEDGMPHGMFYENVAMDILKSISESLPDSYIEKIALKAQELFLQNGITSVNDICTKYERYFNLYKRLQEEGKLKMRIVSAPYGLDEESMEVFARKEAEQSPKLTIGPAKYFIDGSFGSRTALLCEDYEDDKGNCGLKLITDEQLRDIIASNAKRKKATAIHAIGDLAVHCILDAYEAAGIDFHKADIRGRIEHIQIIKNEDIKRFKENNIIASFQPAFLYEIELTPARVGQHRMDRVYKFKSFIESGAHVILNSDWPYGGGDFPTKPDGTKYIGFEPILGIHAACCMHMNPAEAISPEEALRCYTVSGAYANYRETELGRLAKGYLADFVVLSEDILAGKAEDIVGVEVVGTVIDGDVVYWK